jgi:hypothetical protein
VSDSLVAIPKFAIPLALRRFVCTRRGLPLRWIIVRLGTDCHRRASYR